MAQASIVPSLVNIHSTWLRPESSKSTVRIALPGERPPVSGSGIAGPIFATVPSTMKRSELNLCLDRTPERAPFTPRSLSCPFSTLRVPPLPPSKVNRSHLVVSRELPSKVVVHSSTPGFVVSALDCALVARANKRQLINDTRKTNFGFKDEHLMY